MTDLMSGMFNQSAFLLAVQSCPEVMPSYWQWGSVLFLWEGLCEWQNQIQESVMNAPPKSLWGPWSPHIVGDERKAQLRCLRALVHIFVGSGKSMSWDYTDSVKHLIMFLQKAEFGEPVDLDQARILFDALPATRQRDIIATFAVLHKPLAPDKDMD